MRKIHFEVLITTLFVLLGTMFVYSRLSNLSVFWSSQMIWSTILALGWVVVSLGYYHQGWIIHKSKSSEHVSIVLPIAVFVVQCILFVKGIFYHDWSLIAGAVMVNSGVVFSLYQIVRTKLK